MVGFRQLLAFVAALVLSLSWAPRGYGGGDGDAITHADAIATVGQRRGEFELEHASDDDGGDGDGDVGDDRPPHEQGANELGANEFERTGGRAADLLAHVSGLRSWDCDWVERARGPPHRVA